MSKQDNDKIKDQDKIQKEEESMNLTPKQQSVLLTLTTEWQTPTHITGLLSKESGDPSDVNQSLKELLREGLVQANPVVLGLYRLTTLGTSIKTVKLGENK